MFVTGHIQRPTDCCLLCLWQATSGDPLPLAVFVTGHIRRPTDSCCVCDRPHPETHWLLLCLWQATSGDPLTLVCCFCDRPLPVWVWHWVSCWEKSSWSPSVRTWRPVPLGVFDWASSRYTLAECELISFSVSFYVVQFSIVLQQNWQKTLLSGMVVVFFANLLMGCKLERGRNLRGIGMKRRLAATPFPDLSTTTISLCILLKGSGGLFCYINMRKKNCLFLCFLFLHSIFSSSSSWVSLQSSVHHFPAFSMSMNKQMTCQWFK